MLISSSSSELGTSAKRKRGERILAAMKIEQLATPRCSFLCFRAFARKTAGYEEEHGRVLFYVIFEIDDAPLCK